MYRMVKVYEDQDIPVSEGDVMALLRVMAL